MNTSLPSTAAPAFGQCAWCGKPAKMRCPNCMDGVDVYGIRSTPSYCNAGCQREHLALHQMGCYASNKRKELYRAGALAQELFLFLRREMWSSRVAKYNLRRNGVLYLHEVPHSVESDVGVGFPEKLDLLYPEKTAAILTRCSGQSALMLMAPLLHFAALQCELINRETRVRAVLTRHDGCSSLYRGNRISR